MAATLLLHGLLLVVAVWGAGPRHTNRLPDAIGAGANSGNADGSTAERMITIQLQPLVPSPNQEPALAPQLAQPQPPAMIQVTGPDAVPPPPLTFDIQGDYATEASEADLIARTRLAGLYQSQIRARIERAWEQPPHEAYTAALYACRVKILQQPDGKVQEVTLDHCEGAFTWLDSLVKAIYSASPLPGPPHPSVFTETFSMQFRSVDTMSKRAP